jgi:hypothetical protein
MSDCMAAARAELERLIARGVIVRAEGVCVYADGGSVEVRRKEAAALYRFEHIEERRAYAREYQREHAEELRLARKRKRHEDPAYRARRNALSRAAKARAKAKRGAGGGSPQESHAERAGATAVEGPGRLNADALVELHRLWTRPLDSSRGDALDSE